MRSTLSLYGLLELDKTVLDNFYLPAGIEKDVVVENILMETMDMELLYPNPFYMKDAVGVWSKMQLPVWEHLLATTQYEYNPIDNYDRTETRIWSEDRDLSENRDRQDKTDSTKNGKRTFTDTYTTDRDAKINRTESGDSTSSTNASTDDTTTQNRTQTTDKAAYNTSEYEPVDKVVEDTNQTHHNTATGKTVNDESKSINETDNVDETKNGSGDESSTDTEAISTTSNEDVTQTEKTEHGESIKAHGNIGVTTTQEMIKQEREIALFNMTKFIVDAFIERFFLLVY